MTTTIHIEDTARGNDGSPQSTYYHILQEITTQINQPHTHLQIRKVHTTLPNKTGQNIYALQISTKSHLENPKHPYPTLSPTTPNPNITYRWIGDITNYHQTPTLKYATSHLITRPTTTYDLNNPQSIQNLTNHINQDTQEAHNNPSF